MKISKWLMGICSVGLVAGVLQIGFAFAATENNLAFIASYENNELLQAKLQQQVTPTVSIGKLHAQISNLYKMEYTMDAMVEGPTKNDASLVLSPFVQYLKNIIVINANVQATIRSIKIGGQGDSQDSLNQQFKQLLNEDLRMVQGHMKNTLNSISKSSLKISVNNINSLQDLIFALQHELIDLTNYSADVSSPSLFLTKVGNISNIKYDMVSVTPSNHTIRDMVVQLPWVTDTNGNNIPAVGTYSLSSPSGAVGVEINSLTGSITIKPNATSGDYYVVYADGGSYDSTTIHVL